MYVSHGFLDWTVRLLMYNGKLAGRATYQDLLAFSFGRGGLIAISIFQFAFAFGGTFYNHNHERERVCVRESNKANKILVV